MLRIIVAVLCILLGGCVQQRIIPLHAYGPNLVGHWKQISRFPDAYSLQAEGSVIEYPFNARGACTVFEPRLGRWRVEREFLILDFGEKTPEVYPIEKLSGNTLVLRAKNPLYVLTFRRVKNR